jgi:hypothetical protein
MTPCSTKLVSLSESLHNFNYYSNEIRENVPQESGPLHK